MAEPELIIFTYKEIATLLLKQQGIHEGLWSFTVQMGFQAGIIKTGPSENEMVPAAIVPLLKIGITETRQTYSING